MSNQVIDFVNPTNLIWCRKKAGLDIPAVYKKAGWTASTKKVEAWEAKEDFPTISELKKLGKVYKKAWTLFLLEEDISKLGFMVMKDYRGDITVADEKERYELISFANELEFRQNFLLEFSNELDIQPNRFFGSLVSAKDPRRVAELIVSQFGINQKDFLEKGTRRAALNYLQEKLGEHNILVSFSSIHHKKKVSVDTMRGILLRSDRAPIIGINSGEKSVGAQIFSIFHELTHLVTESVSETKILVDKISFRRTDTKTPKEKFCDQVAALILVPDSELEGLKGQTITPKIVESYCIRLKVNVETFLYRALDYNLLGRDDAEQLIEQCKPKDVDYIPTLDENEKKGGPDGGLLHLNKNGKSFVKFVNSLYSEGSISYAQALGVLDVKSSTFNKYVSK
jgi:Zn-dependent peptidase ImmA (M78 family)